MCRLAILSVCYLAVIGSASQSSQEANEVTPGVFSDNEGNDGLFRSTNLVSSGSNDNSMNRELEKRRGVEELTDLQETEAGHQNLVDKSSDEEKLNERTLGGLLKGPGLLPGPLKPINPVAKAGLFLLTGKVCYPVVGCFPMDNHWASPLRPIAAPMHPDKIGALIHFYSRTHRELHLPISLHPLIQMKGVPFDPLKATVFLVHGFSNTGNGRWLLELKDAYLRKYDANVMVVDWGRGANKFNYLQVAGNTRLIARQMSLFINYLTQNHGANIKNMHLIGHSLGAHICSYVGKEIPGIARLTALDPAQPGFEGFDKNVRLDQSDANFVEVLHTDAKPFLPALGFGMMAPHGHVDFYLNGGFLQPGCLFSKGLNPLGITSLAGLANFTVEVIYNIISCPHTRAYKYLTEAYDGNCTFWGRRTNFDTLFRNYDGLGLEDFEKNITSFPESCNNDGCVPMGFNTINFDTKGSFYVPTNPKFPFCNSRIHGLLHNLKSKFFKDGGEHFFWYSRELREH